MDMKEQIYEAMNGFLANAEDYIVEGMQIKDEFADGEECDKIYAQVHAAKSRLNERLGTDDDSDIADMLRGMEDIAKFLSMKMFDYGVMIGKKNK